MTHSDDTTRPRSIETLYKGYRFRSRVEARWAVFFDTLGVRWEYEPEGFELEYAGRLLRYLPDFWLPRERAWIEIKGAPPSEPEVSKMHALALACDRPVVCLVGSPGRGDYYGVIAWTANGEFLRLVELARCRRCDALNYLGDEDSWGSFDGCCDTDKTPVPLSDMGVQRAYEAARSARFEYGEHGANLRRKSPSIPVYLVSQDTPHEHRHIGIGGPCIDCGGSG